jgi:hypothetical protein
MLGGGTIIMMGFFALFQMLAGGPAQATPDSVAVLKAARRAQATFQATWSRNLPERPGGRGDICGQRIGRICYWYEGDDDKDSAPPEPARIRAARGRLLAALDDAGTTLPGDEWIVGQRVRYLLEDSQPASAALVTTQCRAALWWCETLAGFVRHVAGDFAAADSTFSAALADMPADERCRWSELSPLLEGELAGRYRRLDCDARAAFESRWWWLAQPLYSRAGNDRRTEHLARLVMVRIQEGRRTPFGYWADDLRDVLLRYGWPTWWTRDPPTSPLLIESEPRITGHDPSPAFRFTPGTHALDDPVAAKPEDWSLDAPGARERYAPPYAAAFTGLEHQEAVFRRGDSCLVVAAPELAGDTLFAGRAVSVALTLAADEHVLVTARDSGVADAPRAVAAAAPCRPYLLSLEAVAPRERHVARARYGVTLKPRTLAHPAISDLLLFDPPDSLPATLDAVRPRAYGSARVSADRKLGVFWEVYGVDPAGGPIAVSLRLARQGTGLLRRILGIAGRHHDVRLDWQDVTQDSSVAPRALAVDLAGLAPGRYVIELGVTPPGGRTLTARREIRIERP